jgi:hypothetical protein
MKLIIRANTIDQEKGIIEDTKKKLKWYKKNRYVCVLPKGTLEREYNLKDYKKVIEQINKSWKKEDLKRLIKILGVKADKTYNVYLTKYGVGGSYYPPNLITVNISPEYDFYQKTQTIIHEIIHLTMEDFVIKNKLSHWQKEGLIKLLESIVAINLNVIDDLVSDFYLKLKEK